MLHSNEILLLTSHFLVEPIQTDVDFQDLLSEALSREELYYRESGAGLESPLTSLASTPEASPTLGSLELPPAPQGPLPEPGQLPNVETSEQREPSSGRVSYKACGSKIRKARKRAVDKIISRASSKLTDAKLRDTIEKRFVSDADAVHVEDFDSSSFSAASTGFIGLGGKRQNSKKVIKLENIERDPKTKGFRVIKLRSGMYVFYFFWTHIHPSSSSRKPIPILDCKTRVIAALVPPPMDESWDNSMDEAIDVAEDVRRGLPKPTKPERRGKYSSFTFGISQGQGQPCPMRLRHTGPHLSVLQKLITNPAFKRMAGFQSGTLHSRRFLPYLSAPRMLLGMGAETSSTLCEAPSSTPHGKT